MYKMINGTHFYVQKSKRKRKTLGEISERMFLK